MLRLETIGFINMAHKVIYEYWMSEDGMLFGTQEEATQHDVEIAQGNCRGIFQVPSDASDPCEFCSNNPKNGGTGVCLCILGNKTKWNLTN